MLTAVLVAVLLVWATYYVQRALPSLIRKQVQTAQSHVTASRELFSAMSDSGEVSGSPSFPGLQNQSGNICFLNSTLQAMASTPGWIAYLYRVLALSRYCAEKQLAPVAQTLAALLEELNTPGARTLSARRLVHVLASSSAQRRALLMSTQQQDAHELWTLVRDAVEDEARIVAQLPALKPIEDSSLSIGLAGILRPPQTVIRRKMTDPYLHLMAQRVKCAVCGYIQHVRLTTEEQVSLIVPMMTACRLTDLLAEYTKPELISEYMCRRCSVDATLMRLKEQGLRMKENGAPTKSRKERLKKLTKQISRIEEAYEANDFERDFGDDIRLDRIWGPAAKQIRIARMPKILTVHLNRSTHFGYGQATKNSCYVQLPELLDATPYSDATSEEVPEKVFYRLASLIVHYGSHSYGHYVAFRRSPANDGDWIRTSDETVSSATTADVMRANPFLVFYERVEAGDSAVKEEGAGLYVSRANFKTTEGVLMRENSPSGSSELGQEKLVAPEGFSLTEKGNPDIKAKLGDNPKDEDTNVAKVRLSDIAPTDGIEEDKQIPGTGKGKRRNPEDIEAHKAEHSDNRSDDVDASVASLTENISAKSASLSEREDALDSDNAQGGEHRVSPGSAQKQDVSSPTPQRESDGSEKATQGFSPEMTKKLAVPSSEQPGDADLAPSSDAYSSSVTPPAPSNANPTQPRSTSATPRHTETHLIASGHSDRVFTDEIGVLRPHLSSELQVDSPKIIPRVVQSWAIPS